MSLIEELKTIRNSCLKAAFESFLKKLITDEVRMYPHQSSISITRHYDVEHEHIDNMRLFFTDSTYAREYTYKLSRELYSGFDITLSEYPTSDELNYMSDHDLPERAYVDVTYKVYF